MVTKVIIRDNKKCPLRYISELDNFKNGSEWEFKPGVNIIVGENGSGKTTLLNIIRAYLMVDKKECDKGIYNCNINKLFTSFDNVEMLDGADVYGDYDKNVFRLCHKSEEDSDSVLHNFESFGAYMDQNASSTGESVTISLNYMFKRMFSKGAVLKFDYSVFRNLGYAPYSDYVDAHRVECADEWTLLLDEPDRNLDIFRIDDIRCVFDYRKPRTQVIGVLHNPLLIYNLSKVEHINFIEMTPGYVEKVKGAVDKLVSGTSRGKRAKS